MDSTQDAVAFAKARAAAGLQYAEGNCLGFVRDAYGSPGTGGDATHAFLATSQRGSDAFGALAWWTGGSAGHGHVAVSLGDGTVYSTDFGPDRYYGDGRVRLIALGQVSKQSNPAAPLVFQGFSLDLDGQTPEVPMVLVQKKSGGQIYHYTGNHVEGISDHQAQRAQSLGAKLVVLNDTDEIFKLGAPAQVSAASAPHQHTHTFTGTTAVSG